MKLLRLIPVSIIVIVLFICNETRSNGQEQKAKKTKNAQPRPAKSSKDWTWLHENGYSIQYPNDWELDESGQMGTKFIIFSKLQSGNDKFRENINLIIQDLSNYSIDLDQYAEISEKQITDMIADSKILETKRLTKNRLDYYKFVYTGSQEMFQLKFVQYYWVKDKNAFVLTFTTEKAEFDEYWNTGEKMLNSFSFE